MLLRRHHKKEEIKKSVEEKDYSQLTNKELKSLLDEKGIGYNRDAKKADLLKLIKE